MDQPELAPSGTPAFVGLFSHAGASVVVEDYGRGSTTFVLIHGIGLGRSVYSDLTTHLSGRGRFVAIDLPGYGQAPEPRRTLSMQRTADLVAAVLRDRVRPTGDSGAREQIVVIGHSMGTQIAGELAARHPDLVDRLVLLAPTVNMRERTATRQLLRLAQDLVVETPRVIVVGGREYLRAGPQLQRKFGAMLAHRPEDSYPKITAATLVMRGEHDYVSPDDWARFVATSISGASFAEISGHGHETMIRDAAPAAAQIIAFAQV